jgi:rubrerythrin
MLGALFGSNRRRFDSLSEREILALAIGGEEEDGRVYRDMAERVREAFPDTAALFTDMAGEEDEHRRRLIDLYKKRFGNHIPLLRREDVQGFIRPEAIWLRPGLDVERLWEMSEQLERQNQRFYVLAASRSGDADTRKLLGDLAAAEQGHKAKARELAEVHLTEDARHSEREQARRQFVMQIVQPGLAGLMDGSVSTLAPLFAAAMATQNSHATLLVGLASAVGAGISMGFAEAMSDDGKISGRGSTWLRGGVCGLMTTAGGIGHALPYLIGNVSTATALAAAVVAVELVAIAYIRWHYMNTSFWRAMVQVVLGGVLVVLAGVLLGGE